MCVEQFQYCQGCDSLLYQKLARCSIPGGYACRELRCRIKPEKRLCEACLSVDGYFHRSRVDYCRSKASIQGCRSLLDSIDWTVVTQGNDMFLLPTTRFSMGELETWAVKYFKSRASVTRKATKYRMMAVDQTTKYKYKYLANLRGLKREVGFGKKTTITPVPMPESEPKA